MAPFDRNTRLVAGVDIATADVRVAVTAGDGRIVARASAPLARPQRSTPGVSEQDAGSWWPAVADALRTLTDRLGRASDSVAALSVCATSGTVVVLDADRRPVGAALMYSDQRAATEAESAQTSAAERWAALGLRVQPSFGLAKAGWLLAQPDVAAEGDRLAHPSDVVVGRLIGTDAPTDWSHALKSGYDPARGEWATEAMAELGVPPELLPEVRRPTEPAGRVTAEAAEATGLPAGCEVRLGMTDACAAQLAAGAATPGRFVSVLGSTLVLKGASGELLADPTGAVYSHRHPDGWWLPGGASSTGGAGLEAAFPDADQAGLDAAAADHGPASAIVYPLVGRGERFPFPAPDAEGFSHGDVSDDVERYRAILEGVAFVERLGYERLRALGAVVEPPVVVAGGGSRSRVWNRIRATVLDLPVLEAPDASTARGAGMLAAAGSLHPDLSASTEAMAASGDQVDPDAESRAALEASYERFLGALVERGWLDRRPPA